MANTRSDRHDVWASGAAYEPYVGRWSRLVAREFVAWLAVPPGARWLDVGCGTGALSNTIVDLAAPRTVQAIDQSPGFLSYARTHVAFEGASFANADARALPYRAAALDVAVAGLVLNFVPEPRSALQEMARVVRRGGSVAVYVWDYADKMELMRHFWDAALALDPRARELDEGRRFPLSQPGPLEQLFQDTGLAAVEVRAIDIATVFRDFDDYWTPFLGGQGSAPGYAMSLSAAQRDALRERIRTALPIESDGSIHLVARAWAARGQTIRE